LTTTPNEVLRTIDLHAHTTGSDGDHTPSQLIERAATLGLTAIAVTDHDTTAGVKEALKVAALHGIEVVPGIELSGEVERGQCHLLGYFIDIEDQRLSKRLQDVVEMRNNRNAIIVEKMQSSLGFNITLQEVEAVAGGEIVARPHFARVLLEKGYVSSMQEAFDVYLGKGGKAYVDRMRITPEEAIDLVHGAGGVIVLAHPNNLKRSEEETEREVRRLVDAGLDGIEARYNRHTVNDTARYLQLASKLGILTSGGSDFHGKTVKPDVFLGHVEGITPAPTVLLETIRASADTWKGRVSRH